MVYWFSIEKFAAAITAVALIAQVASVFWGN